MSIKSDAAVTLLAVACTRLLLSRVSPVRRLVQAKQGLVQTRHCTAAMQAIPSTACSLAFIAVSALQAVVLYRAAGLQRLAFAGAIIVLKAA